MYPPLHLPPPRMTLQNSLLMPQKVHYSMYPPSSAESQRTALVCSPETPVCSTEDTSNYLNVSNFPHPRHSYRLSDTSDGTGPIDLSLTKYQENEKDEDLPSCASNFGILDIDLTRVTTGDLKILMNEKGLQKEEQNKLIIKRTILKNQSYLTTKQIKLDKDPNKSLENMKYSKDANDFEWSKKNEEMYVKKHSAIYSKLLDSQAMNHPVDLSRGQQTGINTSQPTGSAGGRHDGAGINEEVSSNNTKEDTIDSNHLDLSSGQPSEANYFENFNSKPPNLSGGQSIETNYIEQESSKHKKITQELQNAGINFKKEDITKLPTMDMKDFNDLLFENNLSREQIVKCKKLRLNGRNAIAKHNERKRKTKLIETLEDMLEKKQNEKNVCKAKNEKLVEMKVNESERFNKLVRNILFLSNRSPNLYTIKVMANSEVKIVRKNIE